jgi:DNA polymerase-4
LAGSFGPQLRKFAFGEDDRPLELDDTVKSISSEETFERDTDDRAILRTSLRTQSQDVARKLAKHQLTARTVQVKVRYGDFQTLTRQVSVDGRIADHAEIYWLACYLLGREKLVNRPLRLLGVGVTNLDSGSAVQLTFWPQV